MPQGATLRRALRRCRYSGLFHLLLARAAQIASHECALRVRSPRIISLSINRSDDDDTRWAA